MGNKSEFNKYILNDTIETEKKTSQYVCFYNIGKKVFFKVFFLEKIKKEQHFVVTLHTNAKFLKVIMLN